MITLSAPAKSGYKSEFETVESAQVKAADMLDCLLSDLVTVESPDGEITYCYASQEDADEDADGAYAVQYSGDEEEAEEPEPTTDEIARAATSITELAAILDDEWYDAIEGCYTHLPTWGAKTDAVESLIGRSCAEGDIVSWDTTATDPMAHQYLMRTWIECHQSFQPEHVFEIRTHAELVEAGHKF